MSTLLLILCWFYFAGGAFDLQSKCQKYQHVYGRSCHEACLLLCLPRRLRYNNVKPIANQLQTQIETDSVVLLLQLWNAMSVMDKNQALILEAETNRVSCTGQSHLL